MGKRSLWTLVAWFGLLLALSYSDVLRRLVAQWMTDEDMGHGFFVPAVAIYITWQRRGLVLNRQYSVNWWGLVIVVLAGLQLLVATLGAELFLARTSLVLSLAGIVVFFGGLPLLRVLAFPFLLLIFMVPIPAIIYNQITLPLQFLASRVAETVLSLMAVPVLREGNILELPSQRLSVVEACSGIRSLLSLSFLSLVYSYFLDPKWWMRVALLVATIPIAIASNAARVTITGLISEWNAELATGFFHLAEGWLMFIAGLTMLVVTHWLINLVYRRGKKMWEASRE